jgi:hypothetical protein
MDELLKPVETPKKPEKTEKKKKTG